jgi:ribonuclease Z
VDLDVVFLGTSAAMPTARRSPAALLVRRGGERLLFDCGEGTQRQMLRSSVGLVELREVFLTHFHADHVLGLPGMLKSFALRGRDQAVMVYGPPGLRELFAILKPLLGRLPYRVDLAELEPGDSLQRDGYRLSTFRAEHGAQAVGYVLDEQARPGRFDVEAADALGVPPHQRGILQRGDPLTLDDGRVITPDAVLGPPRPGRKLVLAGDTAPSQHVVEAARDADLLVHEATFMEDERERARETLHSTAADAAQVALAAQVGMLALTHVSTRYFGPELAREARAIFPETVVPKDFDVVELPFPERGGPQLLKGGALGDRPGEPVSSAAQ